jgi:hypothetical protein
MGDFCKVQAITKPVAVRIVIGFLPMPSKIYNARPSVQDSVVWLFEHHTKASRRQWKKYRAIGLK